MIRAIYDYQLVGRNVIIVDRGVKANKSVTNDLERVIVEIRARLNADIRYYWYYRDTYGEIVRFEPNFIGDEVGMIQFDFDVPHEIKDIFMKIR